MDMNQIDIKVFTLITVGTTLVLQIVKKLMPKVIENREEAFAMILPILFTVVAKLMHAFTATPWVDALLWAAGGGVGAGVTHDYVMNPAINMLKGLLGFGKKDGDAPSEPPKQ